MTSEHSEPCLIYWAIIVLHVLSVLLRITRQDLTQWAEIHILKSKPNDFGMYENEFVFLEFGNP